MDNSDEENNTVIKREVPAHRIHYTEFNKEIIDKILISIITSQPRCY